MWYGCIIPKTTKGQGEISLLEWKTSFVCTEGQVLTLKTTSDGFTKTNLLEE